MANVHLSGDPIRIRFRKAAALLLSVSFLLSFAGCKKKSSEENRYRAGRVIQASDPYFHSEVYPVQIPLDNEKELGNFWINNIKYTGDFAIIDYVTLYEIPLELLKAVETTDDGGEIYPFDWTDYQKMETALFDREGKRIKAFDSTWEPFGMAQDKDGNVHMLVRTGGTGIFGMWDPDGERDFLILVIDASGNTLRSIPVEWNGEWDGKEDTYSTGNLAGLGNSFSVLEDGSYVYCDGNALHFLGSDGKPVRDVSDGDRILSGEIVKQDGKNYVMSIKPDLGSEHRIQFKELDLTAGTLGPGIDADVLTGYSNIKPVREGVFVNTLSGCFKYDIAKGTLSEVFNWNDTDVDRTMLSGGWSGVECIPKSENEFYVVGYGADAVFGDEFPFFIHLTRAESNPHAGKKLLVIGGENVFQYQDLISFSSRYSADPESKARIVFVDYTEGMRPDESLISLEQSIYLDSLTGNGPDILVNMSDSIAFRNSEVMEDMNRFFDGKNGIDRAAFFDNIFRACETDGKLYHVPLKFELSGLGVNADRIPYSVGWTFEEFEEASRNVPAQISFLQGTPHMELLCLLLKASLPKFADYQNKKVSFNSDGMRRLLTLVRTYGVEKIPEDEDLGFFERDFGKYAFSDDQYDLASVKFMEGNLLVRPRTISTVYDYSTLKDMSPGHVAFLGYPSEERVGMLVQPTLSMGIVSSSTSKDQAWDFIRSFMHEEPLAAALSETLSVKRDTFMKESRAVMEERNEDYESHWEMPLTVKYTTHPVSEEDIEEVKNLIEHATICGSGDPTLLNIISEEVAAYFAGDRSIDEVLSTIQNRATTVVNEK